MRALVRPARRLLGTLTVPGDKSISHRAAILGGLATGLTEVQGFLEGEDCLGTLRALAAMGVEAVRKGPGHYLIQGVGPDGLQEPETVLDCGNSGTTARLLLGVLAGQPFTAVLTGDDSLRRRPMERVVRPLTRMGATVVGRVGGRRLPLAITGARPLRGLTHPLEVASAQVKSALLLAGLRAAGPVTVVEPAPSRDHTERMLRAFGVPLEVAPGRVTLTPGAWPAGRLVQVPGDLSSAAFFLVAGLLLPEGSVTVKGVGVNPTRTGLLEVLEAMGAGLAVGPTGGDGEPLADLTARTAALRGVEVGGPLIPRLIDEVPILAVAATAAQGMTEIRDAGELRVKESDRLGVLAGELARLGAAVEERPDGLRIRGGRRLRGATVSSRGDHRIAMALIVAGLLAEGRTVVEGVECIETSYPEFIATLGRLVGEGCLEVAS